MDWSNEEYVRLYTRESVDVDLSWEALALWRAMLTKFDRSGVIVARNGWTSIARMTRIPVDVVERAAPELLKDGRVRATNDGFLAPNFVTAQTANKSDKLRQRESRDRRREHAASQVIEHVDVGHTVSHSVTPSHAPSQNVTLCSALPPSAPLIEPSALTLKIQEPKQQSDQQRVTDLFFTRYEAAYKTKPTWGGKQAGQVADLLTKHACTEIIARMNFMFDGKAEWPEPPYTLDCFVSNIDRWVSAAKDKPKFRKLERL